DVTKYVLALPLKERQALYDHRGNLWSAEKAIDGERYAYRAWLTMFAEVKRPDGTSVHVYEIGEILKEENPNWAKTEAVHYFLHHGNYPETYKDLEKQVQAYLKTNTSLRELWEIKPSSQSDRLIRNLEGSPLHPEFLYYLKTHMAELNNGNSAYSEAGFLAAV